MWHNGVPSDLDKLSYLRIDRSYEVARQLLKPMMNWESKVKLRLKMGSFKDFMNYLEEREIERVSASDGDGQAPTGNQLGEDGLEMIPPNDNEDNEDDGRHDCIHQQILS
jgi:hypothetical protein